MSVKGEQTSNERVIADVDADALYQVRLIHSWPPPQISPLDNALVSSFYGLQLELRGNVKDREDPQSPITLFNDGQTVSKTGEIRKPASAPLHFDSNSALSPTLLETLDAITGPFEVIVLGKVNTPTSSDSSSPAIDEEALAALQQMSSVQVENTLLEINGERFLGDRGATGADVYRRLWIVASRASLATPYELTLRRHNLAQTSAKVVPFAQRKDVQKAQIAQLSKLAAQEAELPLNVRRKKLFLVQQLDFEREHYLVAYLSGPLQELHTKIMGDYQWQAYEFGKTVWYFHAPTLRLCAQHPLRSHPEARALIEQVQQQVHEAVRRIQRKTRSRQRRKRLMAAIQAEIQRREEEKRKEKELRDAAARRIQHRIRAYQRRKRFLAIIHAEKKRQEELRRERQIAENQQREERRAEELRQLEMMKQQQQIAENRQREEQQRAEEHRQFELMKQEQQRLQLEMGNLKLELQQLRILKETKFPVHSETQTSDRREEDNAIENMRREEQQRLQQQLKKLEVELQNRKPNVEMETQTSGRGTPQPSIEEHQRAQQRIEELELKLRQENTKAVTESDTQTSARGGNVRDEGVDTGEDLEWQRHLTLLRVTIKNKKKHSSHKNRHTQTENFDGEKTLLASSMLRAPQNAVSFSASRKINGEWRGLPSWQRGNNNSEISSNNSSTDSLLTLKSTLSQFDEFDANTPPTRSFESFFAPDLMMAREQPPPPLVEHPWRQDSNVLPLRSNRKQVEVVPAHQPLRLQLEEFPGPIRPSRTMGNSLSPKQNSFIASSPASSPTKLPYIASSPTSSPTKLPYITRRRNKVADSPS